MKYVIRKIPERDTTYLERLIPNAVIMNDVEHKGALFSFHSALRTANDDAIYIQDDMILCKDFMEKAEAVIAEHPLDVIVLAHCSNIPGQGLPMKSGYYNATEACWLMCTYIPKWISELYLKQIATGEWKLTKRMINGDFDDIDFSRWMKMHCFDVYLQVPNLACLPAP